MMEVEDEAGSDDGDIETTGAGPSKRELKKSKPRTVQDTNGSVSSTRAGDDRGRALIIEDLDDSAKARRAMALTWHSLIQPYDQRRGGR